MNKKISSNYILPNEIESENQLGEGERIRKERIVVKVPTFS